MNLKEATNLAAHLHRDQVDKAGVPYFEHVEAVRDMLTGEPEEVRIAGVLHDSVEDTDMTLDELRRLDCPERSVQIIDAVTRRPGEAYTDFIRRARQDPDGLKVKLADNFHNTGRLYNLEPDVAQGLARRYFVAREILLGLRP